MTLDQLIDATQTFVQRIHNWTIYAIELQSNLIKVFVSQKSFQQHIPTMYATSTFIEHNKPLPWKNECTISSNMTIYAYSDKPLGYQPNHNNQCMDGIPQ